MKSLFGGIILIIVFSSLAYSQTLPWRTLLDVGTGSFWAFDTDTLSKTIFVTTSEQLIRITDNGNTFDTVNNIHLFTGLLSLGNGLLYSGEYGNVGIQKSTDNGNSWMVIFPYWRISDIFYDSYRLWAANEDGVLLFSDDLGNTWETNSFNINQRIVSLCADSPYVYLGTEYGGYYRSENYGINWTRISNFQGTGNICKDSDNKLYLISGTNLMFSSDHGNNWEQQPLVTFSPTCFTIDSYNNLYYSDYAEGFFKSTDQGFNWEKISTFTPSLIEFIDSSIFIINYNYLLGYTPDFHPETGKNMFPLSLNNKYQFMYHCSAYNYNVFSLEQREIIKDTTMDGHEFYLFDNCEDYFRYQKDSNLAFIRYGNTEGLYADFNLYNGQTYWQLEPVSHIYREVSVKIDSESDFGEVRKTFQWSYFNAGTSTKQWFAEDIGIIEESSSWNYPVGGGSAYLWLIDCIIKDTLGNYVFYSEGYKPEITFEPFTTLDLAYVKNFTATINHNYNRKNNQSGVITDGIIFVDSAYVEYFYKKDSIETNKQKQLGSRTPSTYTYYFTLFIDTTLIQDGYKLYYRIVASDKSLIPQYSYSPESGYYVAEYNPVSILHDQKISHSFMLEQNYPNPFNPTTKINYSIAQSSKVVIKVFDVLGNEIKTIVNKEEPAGDYEVMFTASNLPSGIYIYRMLAGSFVKTYKMILLK